MGSHGGIAPNHGSIANSIGGDFKHLRDVLEISNS